jgi:protein involved in polysaccharide export with SLBB domain
MAPPYSNFDYSPQFIVVGGGSTPTANSINSSHIANGTIVGADISNNTITDAHIQAGTITEAKLSQAIQSILSEFETRIYNLEHP